MNVMQTIDIPENRRITLEVPRDVAPGKTILTFTSVENPDTDRLPGGNAHMRKVKKN
jgi:hypothetical protein